MKVRLSCSSVRPARSFRFRFSRILRFLAVGLVGLTLTSAKATSQPEQPNEALQWIGAWGASPTFPVGADFDHQTIREFVRISVEGSQVRLRLSNETGVKPLVIGAVHLAKPGAKPGQIDSSTDHVVTFGGEGKVQVPAGAVLVSDPLEVDVRTLETLAISIFVAKPTGPSVEHSLGMQATYVSGPGNFTTVPRIDDARITSERPFLTGIYVGTSAQDSSAIVTLGDSITDGFASTPDTNRRWPDRLAERLGGKLGVVNAGISGNRILHDHADQYGPSALARFDRDVLSVPGIHYVILLEGINDIGHSTEDRLSEQDISADQIIAGMKQLIARAHMRGVRIYGATLTPFESLIPPKEKKREDVNRWIRSHASFDAVIDFDAATRDPDHPTRFRAEYDCGDHLHPNDAGYKAMADSIDLNLFK
jgi:lysophospholipase L1-like esterase